MDPWRELAAWEDCRDAVRAWAELEGKSPQMADDLARQYASRAAKPYNWRLTIGLGVRLVAWAAESWWHITRR